MPELTERWDRGVRSLHTHPANAGAPAVVLVPGLGALGYLLDTLTGCGAWADAFLLDLPGFGTRGRRPCAPDLPAVAAAAARWVDEVAGSPRVVLAGHSTGAQVALRVAALRPDRVHALVLMGPTFPPSGRTPTGLLRPLARTAAHEPLGLLPATVPYYLRGGPQAVLRFLRSAQADEPEQVITRVSCPVLLARGEHDHLAPRWWLDRLAAPTRRAEVRTVPGAHAFPLGRGGLTSALIAEGAEMTA